MNKSKRFTPILSLLLYIAGALVAASGLLSLYLCHTSITAQIAQGATVSGNELTILNMYISSCIQYLGIAVLLLAAGRIYQKAAPLLFPAKFQPETTAPAEEQPVFPAAAQAQAEESPAAVQPAGALDNQTIK